MQKQTTDAQFHPIWATSVLIISRGFQGLTLDTQLTSFPLCLTNILVESHVCTMQWNMWYERSDLLNMPNYQEQSQTYTSGLYMCVCLNIPSDRGMFNIKNV